MKVNNDYNYIFRIAEARQREEQDYIRLKRQSESIAFFISVAMFDIIIAFASFIFLL